MDNKIKLIKWLSTGAVLTGIALTNLNIFPLNILIHGAGAAGWTLARLFNQRQSLAYEFLLAAAYIRLWHHQLFSCLCRIGQIIYS